MDRIPYTYFIKWTKLNLMYYGVRYAKNCHPTIIKMKNAAKLRWEKERLQF